MKWYPAFSQKKKTLCKHFVTEKTLILLQITLTYFSNSIPLSVFFFFSIFNIYKNTCKHSFNALFYSSHTRSHVSVINVLLVINAFIASRWKLKLWATIYFFFFRKSHYVYGIKLFHLQHVRTREILYLLHCKKCGVYFREKPKYVA